MSLQSRDSIYHRGLNTKRPTIVFFWVPRNLSHHMIRQARTGDTDLVRSREMTCRKTLPWVAGGRRGNDDRKQNTLAPLQLYIVKKYLNEVEVRSRDH
jgi:hypothetical protein